MRQVRVSPRADKEIDVFANIIAQDDPDVALRFMEATQATLGLISNTPAIGSLRFEVVTNIKGLRVLSVNGFENHLVFYIEHQTYVDVIRILHSSRNIPAALRNY